MRHSIFKTFRKFSMLFSGLGLRKKFPLVNTIFKKINRSLSSDSVKIDGHVLFIDQDDSLALTVNGIYEPEETNLLKQIIKPGNVVLDLGANIGYFTLLFARLVGPNGKVYAFEPHPTTYSLLKKNIQANGYGNVTSYQKAVSNRSGELVLYVDKFSNVDHRIYPSETRTEEIRIETVRLDDFFPNLSLVNFIKVDTQGAEALILSGMKNLLQRNKECTLLMEFWPYGLKEIGSDPEAFYDALRSLGFSVFDIDQPSGLEQQVTLAELLERYPVESRKHTNLLCKQ